MKLDGISLTGKQFEIPSDQEIEKVLDYLIHMACILSNINKPWMDNNHGKTASSLAWCLTANNPRHPVNGGIWKRQDCKDCGSNSI